MGDSAVYLANLRSKTRVPDPPRFAVGRERPAALLGAALRMPLVLVSAPAGFGKTSLAREFLASPGAAGYRHAWLSLDEGDDDPVRFWDALAMALERACGEGGFFAIAEAARSYQPPSPADLAGAILQAAAGAPAAMLLVIDDFHLLGSKALMDSFVRFAERLEGSLRLVVLSRTDHNLPVARLAARGILAELRAEDLRFDQDEAQRFLRASSGVALSPEQAAAIDAKAEGWAAGLQLAALSLARRRDADAFIAGFSGSDRYVLDYLVEEVLSSQSAQIRDFLLDSAVLDRFCADLLDALFQIPGGSAPLIRYLEGENLFLVALDDRRRWYRYHHLFSEALREKRRELGRDGGAGLLLGAARWHESAGELERASSLYLQAGDRERAADLLDRVAYAVLSRGERASLEHRIAELGEEAVFKRLELAEAAGWSQVFSGDPSRTEATLDRLERAADDMADEGRRRSLRGAAASMRAFSLMQQGRPEESEAKAREAEALLGPERKFSRVIVPFIYGTRSRMDARYAEALDRFARFRAQAEEWGDIWTIMMASFETCMTLRYMGRLSEAEEAYRRAMGEADRRGVRSFGSSCKVHGNYAEILYERNALDDLEELLSAYVDGGADWILPSDIIAVLSPAVKARIARSRLGEAEDLLGRAEALRRSHRIFPRLLAVLRDLHIRFAAAAGTADRFVPPPPPAATSASIAQATAASDLRLALARGEYRTVEEGARRLAEAALAADSIALFIEAKAMEASGSAALGADASAADAALAALERGRVEGFRRTFVDLFPGFRRPLELLGTRRGLPEGIAAYAASLLSDADPWAPAPAASAASAQAPSPQAASAQAAGLSAREREVLNLLAAGYSNKRIADALFISEGTVKTHVHHLAGKLGAEGRLAIVAAARDSGILS